MLVDNVLNSNSVGYDMNSVNSRILGVRLIASSRVRISRTRTLLASDPSNRGLEGRRRNIGSIWIHARYRLPMLAARMDLREKINALAGNFVLFYFSLVGNLAWICVLVFFGT